MLCVDLCQRRINEAMNMHEIRDSVVLPDVAGVRTTDGEDEQK